MPVFDVIHANELAILFTLGVVAVGLALYFVYGRDRVARSGAIYHAFAQLGRNRFEGLDLELRQVVMEQGLRADDPYDLVVTRASVRPPLSRVWRRRSR